MTEEDRLCYPVEPMDFIGEPNEDDIALDLSKSTQSQNKQLPETVTSEKSNSSTELDKAFDEAFVRPTIFQSRKTTKSGHNRELSSVVTSSVYLSHLERKKAEKEAVELKKQQNKQTKLQKKLEKEALAAKKKAERQAKKLEKIQKSKKQ